jgi:Ca2+/Na+ antiporter
VFNPSELVSVSSCFSESQSLFLATAAAKSSQMAVLLTSLLLSLLLLILCCLFIVFMIRRRRQAKTDRTESIEVEMETATMLADPTYQHWYENPDSSGCDSGSLPNTCSESVNETLGDEWSMDHSDDQLNDVSQGLSDLSEDAGLYSDYGFSGGHDASSPSEVMDARDATDDALWLE